MIVGMTLSPLARRISWKKLPKEAERLGLEYYKSKYNHEFGTITGNIRGHEVEVEPDSDARVTVTFNRRRINLAMSRPYSRPEEGMEDFSTPSTAFNLIFRTRRAAPELAEIFRVDRDLLRAFHRFYLRWMWRLDSIYVSENRIMCSFTYGQYFFYRIPASYLKMIVNDMVDLAEGLESALG